MKKTLFAVAAAFAGAAFAAANDAMVAFSTQGPDVYADGTAVLDGECYALVWTSGGEFTVSADGTADGGELVLAAPVAKGGRCPKVFFEVDADAVEGKYKGGAWSVWLLDTRRWAGDGTVAPAGTVDGRARLVNAAGEVPAAVKVAAAGTASVSAAVASAGKATAVPAGTPEPVITGIKVDGANVYVTVKGTVPCLQYCLASGASPDAATERADAPRSGAEGADEEIVLVAPRKEGAAFFRAVRR